MRQMLTSWVGRNVYYAGTKLCNALQPNITLNHNTEVFMPVMKDSLLAHLQNLLKLKVLKLCVYKYAIFDTNSEICHPRCVQ
jgi:hypothetical protein